MINKLKPPTDLLWPFIVLAGYIFFVSITPIKSNDFWWHLKIGKLIQNTGTIPTTNIFAWTIPTDQPYLYSAWLAEYIFYLIYLLGKLEAIMFLRNVLILLVIIIMMNETYRQTKSWRLSALTICLGGLVIFSNTAIRPQIWSILFFTVFLTILNRYRDRLIKSLSLLLCPVVMIFWVNIHGAFVLGIVLIGIFTIGESMRTFLNRPNHLSWKENSRLALIGFFTFAATLLNPIGARIWTYAFGMTTSTDIQDLNWEWQPPTVNGGISELLFFFCILALLVVLIYSCYQPTFTEVLLITCFTWLAWTATRHIIWFGITVVPILIISLNHIPIKLPKFSSQYSWANLAIMILLFSPVVLVQPWFIENFPLPDTYWEAVYKGEDTGPLVETSEPLKATEYLKEHAGGNLYHYAGYASYLIWELPDQGVFIDPRVELYTREHWEDYYQISDSIHYSKLLAKYDVNRLMLDNERQSDLILALKDDQNWLVEYEDNNTIILNKVVRP